MSQPCNEALAFICRIDGIHKLNGKFRCRYCGISNSTAGAKKEPYMYTGPQQAHLHGKVFGRGGY